ncbi:MAG: hypothetical protein VB130_05570 [Clostridium sp.]|nr:hypothetical protein [Clostridium sp.]
MKIDMFYVLQIMTIIICLSSIVIYGINSLKKGVRALSSRLIKYTFTKISSFLKLLIIENYVSYEKYQIWRFCAHF